MPSVINLKNAYRHGPEMDSAREGRLVDRILLNAYRLYWWDSETKAALQVLGTHFAHGASDCKLSEQSRACKETSAV